MITVDYVPAEAWRTDPGDGTGLVLHRCGRSPDDCAVVVYSPNENAATPPVTISMVPSPLLVLPSTALDGDPLQVLVSGPPDTQLDVAQCALPLGATLAASTCNPPVAVPLPGGLGDTNQRFTDDRGNHRICRDGCQVVLAERQDDGTLLPVEITDVAMAHGQITAAPASGLRNGQQVTVTGTELMPSYDGPVVVVPSGRWVIAQCDASVGDQPSRVDVARRCGPVDGAGIVTVTGSDLTLSVGVHTTVRPVLGDTVNCRTGPHACVLALTRQEQDGTVTIHTTPIAFR